MRILDKPLQAGHYRLFSDEDEELNQPVLLHVPQKRDISGLVGNWIIVWQEAIVEIASDKRLNLTDLRVILVLQAKLDFENWIRLSLSDIGLVIGVARQNVSVSMKKLIEMSVIVLGPSVKNVRTYRLNPAIAWKGKVSHGATERRRSLKVIQGGKAGKDSLPCNVV